MIKAVFCDMDGVILDSMPYHVEAWKRAASEFGFRLDEEKVYFYEGAIELSSSKEVFKDGDREINQDIFLDILKRQKRIFIDEYLDKVKVFKDVPEFLSILKERGLKLALVTSSHKDILEYSLPMDLRRFFDVIVTGDEIKRPKPNPDPYLIAINATKVEPNSSVVIENAPAGIKAAKGARCSCVGICTTLPPLPLIEAGADQVFKSHSELVSHFLTLLR